MSNWILLFFFQINQKYVGSRAPPINFECVEFHFFAAWSFVFKLMNVSVVMLCCPTKTSLRHVLASFRTVEVKVWFSLSIDFSQGICWIPPYKTWCLMLSLHLLVSDRVAVSFTAFVNKSKICGFTCAANQFWVCRVSILCSMVVRFQAYERQRCDSLLSDQDEPKTRPGKF